MDLIFEKVAAAISAYPSRTVSQVALIAVG
jgi:hypothetical protein